MHGSFGNMTLTTIRLQLSIKCNLQHMCVHYHTDANDTLHDYVKFRWSFSETSLKLHVKFQWNFTTVLVKF